MTYADRVRQAVDDEEWQRFRKAMKGLSTADKLCELEAYWELEHAAQDIEPTWWEDCNICIRVDNYLKALARGGQLYPGVSLFNAIVSSNSYNGIAKLPIRK